MVPPAVLGVAERARSRREIANRPNCVAILEQLTTSAARSVGLTDEIRNMPRPFRVFFFRYMIRRNISWGSLLNFDVRRGFKSSHTFGFLPRWPSG